MWLECHNSTVRRSSKPCFPLPSQKPTRWCPSLAWLPPAQVRLPMSNDNLKNTCVCTYSNFLLFQDWFTGIYDYAPISASNTWYSEFTIETYPWDAGTEDGDTFSTENPATDPQVAILQLTKDTVPENGVFLSPDMTTVLPVSRITCTAVGDTGMGSTSGSASMPVVVGTVLAVAAASLFV